VGRAQRIYQVNVRVADFAGGFLQPAKDTSRPCVEGDPMTSATAVRHVLEPAAQQLCHITAKPPFLHQLSPRQGRQTLINLQSGNTPKPSVDDEWITVDGGPTGSVKVRIVRPEGASGPLPTILYTHGAGWVFGNALTHDRLVRELAVRARAAVVFPEYDLSPEAKYPTAIEQIYAVARWVMSGGDQENLDPTNLVVAGDSVGGNMTIAMTLMAKARGDVKPSFQLLFYPVTDAAFDTPSYREFAEGYYLRRDTMQWFWDQYTADPRQRAEITASPLRASKDQLAGLPPALVVNGECDVLRDEGEGYAASLRDAGVPVRQERFGGTVHDFVMLDMLRDTDATRAAMDAAIDAIAPVLHPGG
jgi:acetyl esterase/lipase